MNGPRLNGSPKLFWQILRNEKYIRPSGLAQEIGWMNDNDFSE